MATLRSIIGYQQHDAAHPRIHRMSHCLTDLQRAATAIIEARIGQLHVRGRRLPESLVGPAFSITEPSDYSQYDGPERSVSFHGYMPTSNDLYDEKSKKSMLFRSYSFLIRFVWIRSSGVRRLSICTALIAVAFFSFERVVRKGKETVGP